jgi:hypothetical protein
MTSTVEEVRTGSFQKHTEREKKEDKKIKHP